jgi:macrodomain Ter protein organizer (MatP/YcbG family)
MGQVPFSPQLVMTWNKLKAWKWLIKKLKGGKINSRYFHRVMKAAAISNVHLISASEAEDNLENCRINYR